MSKNNVIKEFEPFDSILKTTFASRIETARLVGIGENPHRNAEIFDILTDLIDFWLKRGQSVLLLLEAEGWLNPALDDFIFGKDKRFMGYAFEDPVYRDIYYGRRGRRFLEWLRCKHKEYPGKVRCRNLDVILSPDSPVVHVELSRGLDPKLIEFSAELKGLFKLDKDAWALKRETFWTEQAKRAIEEYQPDRVLIYAGNLHVGYVGGPAMGGKTIPSVFSLLNSSLQWPALTSYLMALSGEYNWPSWKAGRLVRNIKPIREMPQMLEQQWLRSELLLLSDKNLLVRYDRIKSPNKFRETMEGRRENWDYLIALQKVTYDAPEDF